MVPKTIKIKVASEGGATKNYVLRRFEKEDAHRIFCAWNNPQSYRYNSIDWNESSVQNMVNYSWPNQWGMYFMVLQDEQTGNIVATCRFGTPDKNNKNEWDFGYSTFRSDDKQNYTLDDLRNVFKNGVTPDKLCWGKGYCSIMLDAIIKIAQKEGVQRLISGADGQNWGSQKVMMKNGFSFYEIEDDGDVDFILELYDQNGNPLKIVKPTKQQLEPVWNAHMQIVKNKHQNPDMMNIVKNCTKEHYGNGLFYLLMTRASKIINLQESEWQNSQTIKNLKKEICEIFAQFTISPTKNWFNERELFAQSLNSFKNRWQKRIGNCDFNQNDIMFNLNCCLLVEEQVKPCSIQRLV